MPIIASPFFGINYGWSLGESGWGNPMNTNLKVMSFLHKGAVDDFVASLPVSPTEGDSYVLTTDNQFYVRIEGAWLFITPQEGMEITKLFDDTRWKFEGGVWVETVSEVSLANFTTTTKGAGSVGLDPALAYPANTVGEELARQYTRNEGKDLRIVAGVLRRATALDAWDFIADAGHEPLNGVSVAVSGSGDIRVNYPASTKVVSLVVGVDETFAQLGLMAGASVGLNFADIRVTADMRGLINMADGSLSSVPYWWGGSITTESVASLGWKINHPVVTSGVPVFGSASTQTPAEVSISPAIDGLSTTVTPLADLSGLVSRVASGALTSTSLHSGISVTDQGSGVIRVTHTPNVPATAWPVVSPRLANGALIPVWTTAGAGFFEVKFRDYAGTEINVMPADLSFGWMRPIARPCTSMTDQGFASFSLGVGKIDVNNLYHASGNFWFIGVFEAT